MLLLMPYELYSGLVILNDTIDSMLIEPFVVQAVIEMIKRHRLIILFKTPITTFKYQGIHLTPPLSDPICTSIMENKTPHQIRD